MNINGQEQTGKSTTLVDVIDLYKSYKRGHSSIEVLTGLNLQVQKGELVAIVGKSGVGKSTLLHILGTIDEPDKGTVLIEGNEVFKLTHGQRDRLRNKTIGFIFQFHHLIQELTALENVILPALIGGISKKEAINRAKQLLEVLGISERQHHLPNELSGGEQQRVAIARALIMRPKLVLAAEPTGNLDTSTSKDVNELLKRLNREFRTTFIIATHSMELASIADRILVLENGKVHEKQGGGGA